MKRVVGILALVFTVAHAGPESDRPELQNLSQSGKLITLTVIPQAKALVFSIVGKPALQVRLADVGMDVFIQEKGQKRSIIVTKLSDGKYMSEPLPKTEPLQMEVRIKAGDEIESFDVSVPQR